MNTGKLDALLCAGVLAGAFLFCHGLVEACDNKCRERQTFMIAAHGGIFCDTYFHKDCDWCRLADSKCLVIKFELHTDGLCVEDTTRTQKSRLCECAPICPFPGMTGQAEYIMTNSTKDPEPTGSGPYVCTI